MKSILVLSLVLSFVLMASGQNFVDGPGKKNVTVRVPLAEVTNIKNADPLETSNVPNYIKALAQTTKAAPQFANLVQTFVYGGTVAPETKMAMGLKIAQLYQSGYLSAHTTRWLKASEKGNLILANLKSNKPLSEAEQMAVRYAELLSNDIHGVSDADFSKTRGVYNDSQIVELTMTVCFFNYFTRMVEALNLPVEDWVLTNTAQTPNLTPFSVPRARIGLVSDKELETGTAALAANKQTPDPKQSLGVGIANSQRAMMRVPDLQQAWRDFGFQSRQNWSIDRNIQLNISFAVSMANGCRYCTLHQVLGLQRLGVDPKKLLAMKKDDSALTPRELIAVEFARKLTKEPTSTTDADFAKLKAEFGEQGAVEVIMQTGSFAFMNRFTDGLRLPSEDEAVKTYQEIYGEGTYQTNWPKK
jgi:AhpD family alkylhydroperoxidase